MAYFNEIVWYFDGKDPRDVWWILDNKTEVAEMSRSVVSCIKVPRQNIDNSAKSTIILKLTITLTLFYSLTGSLNPAYTN